MQRLLLVFLAVFTVFLCRVAPLLADPNGSDDDDAVFASQMVCQAPLAKVVGSAAIFNNGDLKLKIPGLKPNTVHTCVIVCEVGGLVAAAPCGPTNAKGKLNTVLPGLGRSGTLAGGCGEPVVSVFDSGNTFCASGYGSPL